MALPLFSRPKASWKRACLSSLGGRFSGPIRSILAKSYWQHRLPLRTSSISIIPIRALQGWGLLTTVNTFSYQPCILLHHSELIHTLLIISLNLFVFLSHLSIYTILCLSKFIFICFSPNSVHPTPSDFHSICSHPRTVVHTATRGRGQNQQAIKQNLILPGVPTLTLISRPCLGSPILLSFLCWLHHIDIFP